MRQFLRLKSELAQQRARVLHEHAAMNESIEQAKQKLQDNLTSITALVSSFAAGAATGWVASKPEEQDIDGEVEVNTEHECVDKVSIKVKKNSLSSDLWDEIAALAVSLIMAEVTKKATALVDIAKEKSSQAPEHENSSSVT